MPRYRVHRMKETPRENFRWAPHTGGLAIVKPKDYEMGEEIEAATPYALWKFLAAKDRDLHPGDVLEVLTAEGAGGELQIAKYIGFEPAQWYAPEAKPQHDTAAVEVAEPHIADQFTPSRT